MPTTCWAPGCTSGYRSEKDVSKRHFFRAPNDSERLALWRRRIPRDGQLMPSHFLCDMHFEPQYMLTKYSYTINGERVEMDRGKWELTVNAVPTIFPNCPKYLSSKITKPRVRKVRSNVVPNVSKKRIPSKSTLNDITPSMDCTTTEAFHMTDPPSVSSDGVGIPCVTCRDRFILQCRQYQLKRRIARQSVKITVTGKSQAEAAGTAPCGL